MSTRHLSTGSELPPKVEGKWRLYSMEYCPFAHRARLVLNVKNIPYEIVNVNLINKPEWLYDINPEGKVPTLDIGSDIIVESVNICNFINDVYPDPPLYPSDPIAKQEQVDLIGKIDDITSVFTRIFMEKEDKTPAQWLEEFKPTLLVFEEALEKSGTFFGGLQPNMLDYMLWPWGERAGIVPMILKEVLPISDDEFVRLKAWRKAMRQRPEIEQIYNGSGKFLKVIHFKTKGTTPDYDNLD